MLKRTAKSGAAVWILLIFALALFPATATESKYVWEDTKTLNLSVVYPNTAITSLRYANGADAGEVGAVEAGPYEEAPADEGGVSAEDDAIALSDGASDTEAIDSAGPELGERTERDANDCVDAPQGQDVVRPTAD